jgi:hypothetical protein
MNSSKQPCNERAATPPEPADQVLRRLLDRYTATVDDTVKSESLAVSARSYFISKMAERRYDAEFPSFNSILESDDIDENTVEEAEEPLSPPRYGRAILRKRREKIMQATIDGDGGVPKTAVNTAFSPDQVDIVDDQKVTSDRYVRGRLSLGGNENNVRSTSYSNSVYSMNMRARRSRRSLGCYEKYGCCSSSKNTVNTPSNRTDPPISSTGRSISAPLASMKPVSDHSKVERLPPKSVISQPISLASKAKPAVPKAPARTISSTSLQRSAGVYRRHNIIATPRSRVELKPTPSFKTSDSHIIEHSTSSVNAKFENDISVALSLFSVACIDSALSTEDICTKSPPRRGNSILNLTDVHSGSIKSKVLQKEKYFDDQSVASTITDATSLLYGISQSMSEESTNETKHFPSQCGPPSKLPMKHEIHAESNSAERQSRIPQTTRDESTNAIKCVPSRLSAPLQMLPTKQEFRAGSTRADRRRQRSLSATHSAPKSSSS